MSCTATRHDPTPAAYRLGCRCPETRAAQAAYHRKWRDENWGRKLVDAAPAREHLERLVATGSTATSIAEATGVSMFTVCRVLKGHPVVHHRTAEVLLKAGSAFGEKVPAIGTNRRVQALYVMGWPREEIGRRLGVSKQRVGQLSVAHVVLRDTAAAVARVYDELSMTPGPSRETSARALRWGYRPPLWWDDDTIDDGTPCQDVLENVQDIYNPGKDDLDEVAIERFVAGDLNWQSLSTAERIEAAVRMDRSGISRNTIADRTRLNSRTLWDALRARVPSESEGTIAS